MGLEFTVLKASVTQSTKTDAQLGELVQELGFYPHPVCGMTERPTFSFYFNALSSNISLTC